MSRRGFIGSAVAFAAAYGPHRASAEGEAAAGAGEGGLDQEAIAFISDIHVGLPLERQRWKTMRDYPHQPAATAALVKEILALPRPPANVVNLGDISLAFGEPEDYEVAAETLKPLYDAGIKVTHAMGNHDIRAEFLKAFPGADEGTKIPGRLVYVVETPHVDIVVLDSLVEPGRRGDYGAMTKCGLGDEQKKWLVDFVAGAKRPLFICAHHPHHGLKLPMSIAKNPRVAGYIHGHSHVWTTGYMRGDFDEKARMLRTVGLPTLGFEMDVGWALLKTGASAASLVCNARDFYYPLPRPKPERPPEWDAHVRDWAGRSIHFAY